MRKLFLDTPNMNVDRCSNLHNKIACFGWITSKKGLDKFEPKTWYEHHGTRADPARGQPSRYLLTFLKRAYHILRGHHFYFNCT